ncbi:hypothetical protein D3C87_1121420 [compost metagenome]
MAGVGLDRVQGNKQLIADFLVRTALGDQSQDRHFPGTELFRGRAGLHPGTGGQCRKFFTEAQGNGGWRTVLKLPTQPVRVLDQQALKGLQPPSTSSVQRLGQCLACFRFPSAAQQQRHFLGQRHGTEHLPTALLAMFEQRIQTPFGQHRLALDDVEQGLLQFDMQRQLRVEFRWRGPVFTVIGLPQARQPGFGQIGAPLGQPEFTFDQGDHGQVVDRRHVPDVHQPFGFSKFGKGFGELAAAAFQPGNHAVSDQHADVTAGPRLAQTGLQSHPSRLRLHAQGQQKAFVQGQPGANRIQPLRRQALQALHSLTDLFQRPTDFPASLQHPGTVVVRQCFEQGVADPLRQFQRFAVKPSCPPQITVGNGQVG